MRKLIYHVAATLDNFIAHPDGSTTGFLTEGEFIQDFIGAIRNYGAVLMGRKTYEYGYDYGLQKGQPSYTQINPRLKNYIFSKSIDFDSNNQIQLVSNDELDVVRQLKSEEGKPLWLCGGGELAGLLLDAHLIDELIIKLNPIVFGEGIRLFGSSTTQVRLDLLESKAYNNGMMRLSYAITY